MTNVEMQMELWSFIGAPIHDAVERARVVRRFDVKKRYHTWRRYRWLYRRDFECAPVIPLAPEPPFMLMVGLPARERDRRKHRTDLLERDPKAWIAWRNEMTKSAQKPLDLS
ncbi:MAG: hypothetical protein KGL39_59370 [Patescibacteria group bacterium]|nr:hypothetical protein [Patescibacteria group bacterium]